MIEKYFSEESLINYYLNNIRPSISIGIDRINKKNFEKKIFANTKTIQEKVLAGKYKFTKYRGVMIPRRPDKLPRTINIATLRDKLLLGLTKELLQESYPEIKQELVQTKIDAVSSVLQEGNYDAFIKTDIIDCFPSIQHNKLIEMLKQNNIDERIVKIINRAIKTDVYINGFIDTSNKVNKKGVPQGLPISNILAEIYLSEFDKFHKSFQTYKYYRYVDDILILCNKQDVKRIIENIKDKLKPLSLNIHNINEGKTKIGLINDGFEFLGYHYDGNKFTVRNSTVQRLEKSIEQIFLRFRRNNNFENINLFLWHLNLRITGAIFESKELNESGVSKKKKRDWVFFFSQIEDKQLLYHLDYYIEKLIDRFDIRDKLSSDNSIKKFVKTYYQVKYNRKDTKYIPNFSRYSIEEKKQVLEDVFKYNISEKDDEDISFLFNNIVFKSVRDLEEDVQDFS